MSDYEPYAQLVDRIRNSHLALIISSILVIIALSSKIGANDALKHEIEKVDELDIYLGLNFLNKSIRYSAQLNSPQALLKAESIATEIAKIHSQINGQQDYGKLNTYRNFGTDYDLGYFGGFANPKEWLTVANRKVEVVQQSPRPYSYSFMYRNAYRTLERIDNLRHMNTFLMVTGIKEKVYGYKYLDGSSEEECTLQLQEHNQKIDLNLLLDTNSPHKLIWSVKMAYLPTELCDFINGTNNEPQIALAFKGTESIFTNGRFVGGNVHYYYIPVETAKIPVSHSKYLLDLSMNHKDLVTAFESEFPELRKFLSEFNDIDFSIMNSKDLNKLVDRITDYESDKIKAFGFEVRNDLIFPWAIIFISALLVHFSMHLNQAIKMNKRKSAWFGFYDELTAKFMLWISVLVMPLIAICYAFLEATLESKTDYFVFSVTLFFVIFSFFHCIRSMKKLSI